MAVTFTIREKGDSNATYTRCFLRDRVAVGRARLSDICLPDMAVSTRHAEISLKGGSYAVMDLGSLNGTRVNDNVLVPHRKRTLSDGDVIQIGTFDLAFSIGAHTGAQEPRDASLQQARKILSSILERAGTVEPPSTLAVTGGPSKGARYVLPNPPASFEIGRNKDADLILEDRDASRNHAEILVEPNGIVLHDLGSRNGVFVDGERIESIPLEPGMSFRLGKSIIALEHPIHRSLMAIFDAPEEETSSFSNWTDPPDEEGIPEIDPPSFATAFEPPQGEVTLEPPKEVPPPPVGPADPLVAPFDSPIGRTTAHLPKPYQEDLSPKSDLGLIIIGAVIVVAAVLALVYLFT